MNEDAIIEKPKIRKKIEVKVETKKQKCLVVERFKNTTNILLNNMVYSIENSKIKKDSGNSILVEYVVEKGNVKFI